MCVRRIFVFLCGWNAPGGAGAGPDKVARAIEDAFEFRAFSSDYIANILEQRERLPIQPGPLHLTRRSDLLDVELAPVDISVYDPADTAPTPDNA